MTDRFETRLARVLREDAESAIVPVDAMAIATAARAAVPVRGTLRDVVRWRVLPLARTLVVLGLLLLAIALAAALAAGGRDPLALLRAAIAPAPSAVPSVAPSPVPGVDMQPADLAGAWIAQRPAGLAIEGESGTGAFILSIEARAAYLHSTTDPTERMWARLDAPVAGRFRFIARAVGDPVLDEGAPLRPCAAEEEGTYGVERSADGLLLTLSAQAEACPSRERVLERTWVRYLGRASSGGLGVVDAFDPLFTVTLPPGSLAVERHTDALTVYHEVPEFQFIAWRDPQGFMDPCDIAAGRRAIAPGADAFVDYFRQLEGFTVDSTEELEVDGHRAVRLVLHANPDSPCPDGRLAQWQPKAETGDQHWFLRPGDTDSLVIVELADDVTVMFKVLPAPHQAETEVIGSIRFLDALPASS